MATVDRSGEEMQMDLSTIHYVNASDDKFITHQAKASHQGEIPKGTFAQAAERGHAATDK